MEPEGKATEPQGAVSFVVSFNDSFIKQKKLPKSLAARRNRQARSVITEESLAEKQRQAEERRKVTS